MHCENKLIFCDMNQSNWDFFFLIPTFGEMVICEYIHNQNGILCSRCLLKIRVGRNFAESDAYEFCFVKQNEASAVNIPFNE